MSWARRGPAATEVRPPVRRHDVCVTLQRARLPLVYVTTAGLATVSGVLPPFLLGALSKPMMVSLPGGESSIGLAISLFFATTAASSRIAGRWVDQHTYAWGLGVGASVTLTACVGFLVLPISLPLLLGLMFISGIGYAVSAPASAYTISAIESARGRTLAFGLKQAFMPAATLVTGGAVTLLFALDRSWRWGFTPLLLLCSIQLLVVAVSSKLKQHPRTSIPGELIPTPPRSRTTLLSLGGMLGAAVAASVASFFVVAVVAGGAIDTGEAGALLAIASLMGIASRVGWSTLVAFTRIDSVVGTFVLTAIGSVSLAVLAFGSGRGPVTGGVLGFFVFGWSWPGLFLDGVVSRSLHAAGQASGSAQAGMSLGSAFGPLLFGFALHEGSPSGAWFLAALGMGGASAAFWISSRRGPGVARVPTR